MGIYEMIQDGLNDSEWKKHAKNFIKQRVAAAEISTTSSDDSDNNDDLDH